MLDLIEMTMPKFRSDLDPKADEKYDAWVAAAYDRLGYNREWGYLFSWSGGKSYVFAKLDGRLYKGNEKHPFLHIVKNQNMKETLWPGMICKCSWILFQINNNKARCSMCGATENIWDGNY